MEKIDILRTIRAHGFMAKDIAARLDITTVAISQQIQGNPRLGTLRKIADAIGCNIVDFFYQVDENDNNITEHASETKENESPYEMVQEDMFSLCENNQDSNEFAQENRKGTMSGFFVFGGKKFQIVEVE